MLAFGLGSLPTLMLAGLMAVRLRVFTRLAWVRNGGDTAVLLFGIYGGWYAIWKTLAARPSF